MLRYFAFFLLIFSFPLMAEEGKTLAFRYKCMTCHGARGISPSSQFPHLAGQSKLYLVTRLQYFAAKQEPYSRMFPHAVSLTEEEIEELADYFSSQAR